MTNEEFNKRICHIIQAKLPYRLRAPFTLRLVLLDGFWYEVPEACQYMKLSEDEFIAAIRGAASLICKELLGELDDDARASEVARRPTVISQLALSAPAESVGVSINQIRSAALATGFHLAVLGKNLVSGGLFGVLAGKDTSLLLDIGQSRVAWYRFIVAALLRRRQVMQTHPGGYHLGIIAFQEEIVTGTECLELSDVDLRNDKEAASWISATKMNLGATVDLPWEYRPQI